MAWDLIDYLYCVYLEPMPTARYHGPLVAAIVLLLYAGTLDNALVFDDRAAIADNPVVHRGDPGEIFTADYWAGYHADRSGLYRPLTTLSYALQYRWFGATPYSYHLVNILLHALAALLLYRLVCDLLSDATSALYAALLFAVHPALSEAVCAAVGRADLLAAALVMAALILHLRGQTTPAGLAYLAALLCKESAIVAPALLLLVDVFQYRTFSQKRYSRPYLFYGALTLAYLSWRYYVLGAFGPADIDGLDNPLAALAPSLRLLNALVILGRYLGLLALPTHLSADYSHAALPLAPQFFSWSLALVCAGSMLVALVLYYTWHRRPWACCGLAWTLLALVPVANILLPIGTIMAERLLYLPAMGFCFALAVLLHKMPRGVLIVLLALLSLHTTVRGDDWQDDHALFASAVAAYPQSARAWHALGKAHLERGENQQGRQAFDQALAIFPNYYEVYNDLGAYHLERGEYQRALGNLEAALRIDRKHPPTWLNLGLAFYHLQRHTEARQAFAQALRLSPDYSQAQHNLALLDAQK
jgi:hypothetical protein